MFGELLFCLGVKSLFIIWAYSSAFATFLIFTELVSCLCRVMVEWSINLSRGDSEISTAVMLDIAIDLRRRKRRPDFFMISPGVISKYEKYHSKKRVET